MFVCPECGQRYERAGTCSTEGATLAATSDPLLGTEIDRYRLARLLGEGGMGRVYLAVQPAIGSRVAIKILSDECSRNAELLDRFFAEARAVNLIRHENIISVLDLAILPDGRPFIVMEYVEGHTLSHFVRGTATAPLGGVVQVVGEVLGGLAAAHAIGIVHRDLKPDNVLVTREGHAKVLDFGIAKLAPGLRPDLSPRTQTGALLGTPAYMAPEQISGAGNVDARTDVYAAGILLYEAVTGAVPFTGATLFDLMRAHIEQAPPPPRTRRPDIPPGLEQVILQALAKDPSHRFQSATAMAQALVHATATLPPEQWRPLSTRGGPRISAAGPGNTTDRRFVSGSDPTQRDGVTVRGIPDTSSQAATTQPDPPAATTQRDPRPRGRGRLVAGVLAIAAVAGGIGWIASSRTTPATPAAPPTVAASPTVASAGSATSTAPVLAIEPVPAADPASPAPAAPSPVVAEVTAPSTGSGARARTPVQPVGARDAGVAAGSGPSQIGSNVQVGSGVQVHGVATPVGPAAPAVPPPAPAASKTSVRQAADYDPRRFDPVAYLPKALALAQQLLPDARLTRFDFDPVFSDGRIDLTIDGRDRQYEFRSPSRSARPANLPPNLPAGDRPCMVYVEIGTSGVTARIVEREDCDDRLVRHPRCRFAGVWKQAQARGVDPKLVARIAWLSDEKWFFDTGLGDASGQVETLPDSCP